MALTPQQVTDYYTKYGSSPNPISPAQYEASLQTPTTPAPATTTLAQDQARVANQGKAGYDVFGNPITATSPVSNPTTYSSANIRENILPDYDRRMTSLQQATSPRSTHTDQAGFLRYDDDKALVEAPVTASPTETGSWEAGGVQYGAAPAFLDSSDPDNKRVNDLIGAMLQSNDAITRQLVGSIKTQYGQYIDQQKEINRRQEAGVNQALLAGGTSRYAPINAEGIVATQASHGLQQLASLEADMQNLVTQAMSAKANNDWKAYGIAIDAAEKRRAEKNTLAIDLNKKLIDANQKAQQQIYRSTRDNAIAGLFAQGITSPTQMLDYLNYDDAGNLVGDFTIEEVDKALKALTTEKKSPSGEYGEFLQLKEAGDIPKDMGWFQYLRKKGDSSRAASSTGEGIVGGGVSGVVSRDADTIMAGNGLRLDDLPTKGNYRGAVAAELAKRKETAKASGDTIGIIRASAGGKATTDNFNTSFEKAVNVVYQLADLQAEIEDEATGPISGIIRSNNPYDVKAQQIKAQLQAIVPNIARGIYGEVGVLTDNDIKNYSRTLPNLTNPEDVRNAILGITMLSVQRSLENKIRINANQDLTHIEDTYLEVKSVADKYLQPLQAQQALERLDNADIPTAGSTSDNASFFGGAQ